jgi:hypothetical protein
MHVYDIIYDERNAAVLSPGEICFVIDGFSRVSLVPAISRKRDSASATCTLSVRETAGTSSPDIRETGITGMIEEEHT